MREEEEQRRIQYFNFGKSYKNFAKLRDISHKKLSAYRPELTRGGDLVFLRVVLSKISLIKVLCAAFLVGGL